MRSPVASSAIPGIVLCSSPRSLSAHQLESEISQLRAYELARPCPVLRYAGRAVRSPVLSARILLLLGAGGVGGRCYHEPLLPLRVCGRYRTVPATALYAVAMPYPVLRYVAWLPPYAVAMPCPALTYGVRIPSYAMSGTDGSLRLPCYGTVLY